MSIANPNQLSNKALVYAIGYVGLSTITLYSTYPSDPFAFDMFQDNLIYWILLLLTFPGQLFSWGIRFGGVDSNITEATFVFISQVINVLIWWKFLIFCLKK